MISGSDSGNIDIRRKCESGMRRSKTKSKKAKQATESAEGQKSKDRSSPTLTSEVRRAGKGEKARSSGVHLQRDLTMPSWSCDPVKINFLTYAGTSAVFTAVFFLDMPHLPYPIQDCLLDSQDPQSTKSVKYLALTLWNIHFVRRTIEVLFVHIYKRRMPFVESIGAPIYYWFLALFISWSFNGDSFQCQSLISAVIGAVIFLAGEAGNALCHLKLRFFRTKKQDTTLISPDTGHIMPHGVFFNHISCPHYVFEITTWTGFFLVVWTLPSALLLLFTVITLAIYANKKHAAYVSEFDGEYGRPLYPKSRKRLIPFLF